MTAHAVSGMSARFAAALVLQAPPPVVARSLGFGYGTATEHAIAAGGTWNRYPAAQGQHPGASAPQPGGRLDQRSDRCALRGR